MILGTEAQWQLVRELRAEARSAIAIERDDRGTIVVAVVDIEGTRWLMRVSIDGELIGAEQKVTS